MDQKKLIITSIVFYLIGASAAYLGTSIVASPQKQSKEVHISQNGTSPTPSEPLTEECPTNGMMYGKSAKAKWEKRRPLAVVIENHKESRPQSGISSADVVYEAVAEGGVTRTLSIFYCEDAKTVGPVRSARVHFINLLREWGNYPLYAHVGGANCDAETGSGCGNGAPADALGLINKLGWGVYNDLNQFSISYPYYWRDYDRLPGVATEHTVYTNTSKLWEYAATNRKLTNVDEDGVAWNEEWDPWSFADDSSANQRDKVALIEYGFYDVNTSEYGVRWAYDSASNTYKRFNGGKPHTDYNTEKQLEAKNVLVMVAPEYLANDDYPGNHIIYKLTGSGDMYAYQNGKEIKGTWEKDELDSKMRFLNENGKEIPMVRGKVWISLIPEGNKIISGAAPKTTGKTEAKPSNTLKKTPVSGE